ncbi:MULTISPECIES: hypothetical protein [unclassified Streptomyces]|nr:MULTISPECIES: hypothetical protein [unclassified Streptomyces]
MPAGDGNYSVRYFAENHNLVAGGLLDDFYRNERVIGREAFYVEVN